MITAADLCAPGAAELLKAELEKPGRSQSALGRHLGLDPSGMCRLVNGKRDLKAWEVLRIIHYLDGAAVVSGQDGTTFRPFSAALPGGAPGAVQWDDADVVQAAAERFHEPDEPPLFREDADTILGAVSGLLGGAAAALARRHSVGNEATDLLSRAADDALANCEELLALVRRRP